MEPNIAESRILAFTRIISGALGFLSHIIIYERMEFMLSSEMFDWATRKTGVLAWEIFVGFPVLITLVWTLKLTWPITARRQKKLFVVLLLICQIVPAFLGWWIGHIGLWEKAKGVAFIN